MYGGAAGAWLDPCYHQICDNLSTVLTGVPPITAEGPGRRSRRRRPRRRRRRAKMQGGALKSLKELGSAATYAVWYFAQSQGPVRHQAARTASRNQGQRGQQLATATNKRQQAADPFAGARAARPRSG